MNNVIDIPWNRIYRGTPTTPEERKTMYKDLFLHNLRKQTKELIKNLNEANIEPDLTLKVIDQENPSKIEHMGSCWIITKSETIKQHPSVIGSDEVPGIYRSISGFAITPYNLFLQYGALENNIKNGEIYHVRDRHLIDDVPDSFLEHGDTGYMDLIKGMAELSIRYQ